MKSTSKSLVQMLPIGSINKLCEKHEVFGKKFEKFQYKTEIGKKSYPLDFIMRLPPTLLNKNLSKDQ